MKINMIVVLRDGPVYDYQVPGNRIGFMFKVYARLGRALNGVLLRGLTLDVPR